METTYEGEEQEQDETHPEDEGEDFFAGDEDIVYPPDIVTSNQYSGPIETTPVFD